MLTLNGVDSLVYYTVTIAMKVDAKSKYKAMISLIDTCVQISHVTRQTIQAVCNVHILEMCRRMFILL